MQKVTVVVSDKHIQETARMKVENKRNDLWRRHNALGRGRLANDAIDILAIQYKRIVLKEDEHFPWKDILNNDPHMWITGTQFRPTRENLLAQSVNTDITAESANQQYRSVMQKLP